MSVIMSELFQLTHSVLDEFARAGGGGSGGGGGGGGGSGGGGGIGALIFAIGYFPAERTTKFFAVRVPRVWAGIVGGLVGLIVTGLSFWLMSFVGVIVAIGAAVGVHAGLNDWQHRLLKSVKAAKTKLRKAQLKDHAWMESALRQRVAQVFADFQFDWSTFNIEHIKTYTTPEYYDHMRLILLAMQQMDRRNRVLRPNLLTQSPGYVQDDDDNSRDVYAADIYAWADDRLEDTRNNKTLYVDASNFQEKWWFRRQGDTWMLSDITQATADALQLDANLVAFAEANEMHYSLDMGRLLLPQKGQLFAKANFKRSDINNHVIGEWKGLIVQIYTYIPYEKRQQADNFLVGQIALPKSYGSIIIKRRRKFELLHRVPRGYTEVSFEWPDFNRRYHVYATDMERVTSFELLNPTVMAKIYDKNLPINIEVVDNVVYFYAQIVKAGQRYGDMLDVLRLAFDELKR